MGHNLPPRPMRGRPSPSAPPADLRKLSRRIDETATAIGRNREGGQPQSPKELVQIYSGGAIPTTGDKVFLGYPVEIDAPDQEGATPTFTPDSSQSIPVVVIRNPAVVGDLLIAKAIAGRWVADKGGSQQPKQLCRWICGPYVQFATPTGCGGLGVAATASIAVADDGTIAGVTLIDSGSCYTVPHPSARVLGGVGTGATLLAAVGEVVSLNLTNAGTGYDPATPPAVTIGPPGVGGTTATATATVGDGGTLTGLTLTNSGALYLVVNPMVSIAAPPGAGVQATATAVARPGVVTSLKLTAPGTGYISNATPSQLNLTVACPTWTVSITLTLGGAIPAGDDVAAAPAGSLPYCNFGGKMTLDIPGAGSCGLIRGATVTAGVYQSVKVGGTWVLNVSVGEPTLYSTGQFVPTTFGGVGAGYYCLSATPTFGEPGIVPCQGGPLGSMPLSCPSRPFSSATTVNATFSLVGCVVGWWIVGGGTTAAPVPFMFTLSEPPP